MPKQNRPSNRLLKFLIQKGGSTREGIVEAMTEFGIDNEKSNSVIDIAISVNRVMIDSNEMVRITQKGRDFYEVMLEKNNNG